MKNLCILYNLRWLVKLIFTNLPFESCTPLNTYKICVALYYYCRLSFFINETKILLYYKFLQKFNYIVLHFNSNAGSNYIRYSPRIFQSDFIHLNTISLQIRERIKYFVNRNLNYSGKLCFQTISFFQICDINYNNSYYFNENSLTTLSNSGLIGGF